VCVCVCVCARVCITLLPKQGPTGVVMESTYLCESASMCVSTCVRACDDACMCVCVCACVNYFAAQAGAHGVFGKVRV